MGAAVVEVDLRGERGAVDADRDDCGRPSNSRSRAMSGLRCEARVEVLVGAMGAA